MLSRFEDLKFSFHAVTPPLPVRVIGSRRVELEREFLFELLALCRGHLAGLVSQLDAGRNFCEPGLDD